MRKPLTHSLTLPAVRFALCLAAGIVIGDTFEPSSRLALLAALGALTAAVILRILQSAAVVGRIAARKPADAVARIRDGAHLGGQLSLYVLVVLCGVHVAAQALEDVDTALLGYADFKERVVVRGVIEDYPTPREQRVSFALHVMEITQGGIAHRVDARTLAYYSPSAYTHGDTLAHVARGDTVIAEGSLRSARPVRNPAGFNFRSWLARQGFTTTLGVNGGRRLRVAGTNTDHHIVHTPVAAIRAWLRERIHALYPPERADLMDALLLGEQGRIDEDMLEAFRTAGVIHLVAVSGGHVAIVLALLWLPLGRMRYSWRVITALLALCLYGLLTGLAPPVTRSIMMAAVFMIGVGFQRISDSINTLAVAAIAILLVTPGALYNAGFQLSFIAVFSLIWLQPQMVLFFERRLPRLWEKPWFKHPVSVLLMTAAAQAGTLPIIAALFGTFSIVSFAANLVAVPLMFVVMAAGFPAVLLAGFAPFPAMQLAAASDACLWLIVVSSQFFAALPNAVLPLPALPGWVIAVYAACMLYLFGSPGRLRWRLGVVAAIVLASVVTGPLVAGTWEPVQRLRVTFIDVGQGDATLLEFPNGSTMLVDAGIANASFDAGARIIAPLLHAKGIDRLDALVLTHPDNDHMGGAPALLRAFSIGHVYHSFRWKRDDADERLTDSLMRARAMVRDVRAGDTIALDPNVRISVLSPPRDDGGQFASNFSSTVIRVVYGGTSFLLTGDADVAAERIMVDRFGGMLKSDVLKVGHHGSVTSTCPAFALAVHPRWAVISCGRLNQFNHPRQDILTRLRLIGATVLRTDISGAIVLESDGRAIRHYSFE